MGIVYIQKTIPYKRTIINYCCNLITLSGTTYLIHFASYIIFSPAPQQYNAMHKSKRGLSCRRTATADAAGKRVSAYNMRNKTY